MLFVAYFTSLDFTMQKLYAFVTTKLIMNKYFRGCVLVYHNYYN